MKTIIEKNKTYKITGEKGDFYITEDNKGKVKMFVKTQVTVTEVDKMPKLKKYKKQTVSQKVLDRDHKTFMRNLEIAKREEINMCSF